MLPWVAGHMGSTGNEAADALAKAASEFGSSDNNLLLKFLRKNLPDSLSVIKQNTKLVTSHNTKCWWKHLKQYK
jgi:hypothetical protein